MHVHTCSLDHPAALSAYLRAGFKAYKRAIGFPTLGYWETSQGLRSSVAAIWNRRKRRNSTRALNVNARKHDEKDDRKN